MPKKKRKPYTISDKRLKAHSKMTNWSRRAEIYSLRYDQKMKVTDIAKIYKISTKRVYKILSDCKVRIKPD